MKSNVMSLVDLDESDSQDIFYVNQAVSFARAYEERHLAQRLMTPSLDLQKCGTMSFARLQALHEHGREMLAEKFSQDEYATLLTCFQDELFFPDAIDDMAGTLADDGGEVEPSQLTKKVIALTHLERYALADLLEQSWYKQNDGQSVFDVAESLGMKFA